MSVSKFQIKIVSGAQTGVDRAALDAAMQMKLPCGGWCPLGRMAEDGIIPHYYPVVELSYGGYRERTMQNVIDSDGTFIIYSSVLNGGTLLTEEFCRQLNKPSLTIDVKTIKKTQASQLLQNFVEQYNIQVLNIAGPRASKSPQIYSIAFAIVIHWIGQYGISKS